MNTRTRISQFADQPEARFEEICDRALLGEEAALEDLKSVISSNSYLL
jgi:hypothetical protein